MRLALTLVLAVSGIADAPRRFTILDGSRQPAARPVPARERISGRVELDVPLPPELVVRATVYLRGPVEILETAVAADGSFAFELPEGALWGTLDVECPILAFEGGVVFEPGWTNLRLRPQVLAVVQGRVHVPVRARPDSAPDGELRIECGPVGTWGGGDLPRLPMMQGGTLHEDGWFRVERLPTGVPLSLHAWIGRTEAVADVWPLAPGEIRTQELTLRFPGTLRGEVADEQGLPVEMALVSLYSSEERAPYRASTDADGRFEIEGVSPGCWAVEARAIGLDLARQELELAEDGESELRFVLGRPAVVRGEVRLPDGSPCTRAEVSETDYGRRRFPVLFTNGERPRDRVDGFGRFAFSVHTGSVQLVAGAAGWAPSAPVTLDLAPGSRREGIVLVLREPARLELSVLDPSGLPALWTTVSLSYPDGTTYEGSSCQGLFAGMDLPAGAATLTTLSWPDVWGASAEVELWPDETTEVELRLRYR